MAISLTCSACGKRLKARDELAGKRLPCPSCGHQLLIPQAEENIAGYLLQDEPPPESPPPAAIHPPTSAEDEPSVARRRPPQSVTKSRKVDVTTLPPLTTNEPPL